MPVGKVQDPWLVIDGALVIQLAGGSRPVLKAPNQLRLRRGSVANRVFQHHRNTLFVVLVELIFHYYPYRAMCWRWD